MKATSISIIIVIVLIVGGVLILNKNTAEIKPTINANNVTIVDGKQIIEINAKGGYQPQKSVAKEGIPTIIRFNTNGTFDCSSFVSIPNMGISKNLPQSGITDIDIGTHTVSTLNGACGMGMYPFEVEFIQ